MIWLLVIHSSSTELTQPAAVVHSVSDAESRSIATDDTMSDPCYQTVTWLD